MLVDGVDSLAAIRRRLFELAAWFGEDVDRLQAAQARWRKARQVTDDDELWRTRVRREVDYWLTQIESPPLTFAALAPESSAERALLELEALDHAAWLWAGAEHNAVQVFGFGDHARYLVRLGRERLPPTARQTGLLSTHLRYHAIVPARVTSPARPAPFRVRFKAVEDGFEQPLARAQVGLATTSFDDRATIEWNGERAMAICNGDDRAAKLWAAIQAAERDGFDVLVAPELTVTPAARRWITQQLRWRSETPGEAATAPRLALVVPGSFHEQVGARFVHRALVLDGSGNAVLEHHKMVSYGKLADFMEDIQLGDCITVLVTPIGTVAIAICKDFCDDHLGAIWHQIQPEWLLVPAYGGGVGAHKAAASRIGRMLGTVTVLAHQGDATQDEPSQSFIHDASTATDTTCSAPSIVGRKISI